MNPIRSLVVAAAFVVASFVSSAQTLTFIGNSNKNALEYACGEEITFTVSLVDKDANNAPVAGLPLKWTLSGDDSSINKSGTATSATDPLTVKTSMSTPGFVRLRVEVQVGGKWLDGNTEFFDGGAGVDVMNISQKALPADFASFWRTETNRLYTTPYTVVCTNFNPSGAASGVVYKLFDITTFEGEKHATGILAMPDGADPKECGIIATFNGYGWGRTGLPNATDVKKGNIIIAVTRHGEDPVNDDPTYYDPTLKNEMGLDKSGAQKSYCWRNNDYTVQDTDFYKMLMRDLRAMQWTKSLPEWNGTALKTSGGSMGGYQAIGCASLDAAVTECNASIPWCSDLSGGVEYRYMTGWRPDWTANLDYVDLKNLATLMKCPVTFSAGLGDYVCPPSGEINLYKNLPTPKKATFTQNMGHGSTHGPDCANYSIEDQGPLPPPPPVTHRTLEWQTDTGNWDVAANWKDVAGGTNAVPRDGDILNIKYKTNGQNSNNNLTGLKLYRLNIASGFHWVKGNELVFLDGSYGIHNEGFMYVATPLAVQGTNVTIDTTSFNVFAWNANGKAITSYDGKPCGIVKTGSGNAGCQPNNGNYDFTGFKYITVKEGSWCFNVNGTPGVLRKGNVEPPNIDFIFAKAGAGLMVGGDVLISGLTLFETGTAVGGAHEIKQQGASNYGTLTITGTPSVDRQIFTGKVTGGCGFVWAPDSSAKEFVFKGGISPNTGKLGVRNGTLRLSDGASFTALSELEVSGGANSSFIVETLPSKTFQAAKLTIGTGAETVSLPAGMTLEVETASVNGMRLRPGAYSRANATWLTGDGTVTVTGVALAQTLVWCGEGGDGLWSNPQNWTNAATGAHDAPYPGDTLNLMTAGSVTVDLAGGMTFATPSLTLGSETVLSVPAGVTLDATNALRGFTRVAPDSYAGCDWVTGGGAVRVEAMASCHLKWSGGGGGNKNWSNAANWVNQTTMQPDVPQNGDTLTLASGGSSQTLDMPNFKPYRLNIPGGYSDPRSSSPLIFEEGSWGIYNQGYMYVYTPIVVRAKKVTMFCSSTGGYADGFYNDQGNTFGFEKTGPGVFAFKTGASSNNLKFTGLKDIVITEGGVAFGWQKTGQMKWFEPGIEVTFNGANTSLKFDQTTTFTNFVIRETANAIGKVHNINEEKDGASTVGTPKTFTIAGAPALSPMTFTGDILSPMSFGWAPDNATNEFVFVGQEVTCTNTITAAGGVMRLTDGASFTKLGTLELKGGALTTFVVDTAPAKTFHVKNLVLETGRETLRVSGGVVLSFDNLTVADAVMPTGVYDRRGIFGTKVDWIEGNGCLSVGGAPVVYPTEAETGVPMSWTANGGNDTSIGNGSNWGAAGSTALPDFAAGSLVATFGAGTGAQLDRKALFKGLNLAAPSAFAFTAAGSAAQAFLGSGGITTAGSGRTYDWAWPVYLMANQAWTVAAGDVLNVSGDIGAVNAEQLTLNGAGTVNFNVPLDYDGQVNLRAGTINLNADDALGASATQPLAVDMANAKFYLNGVTVNRTIRNDASVDANSSFYVKAGTVNVLNGDFDMTSSSAQAKASKINMGANSTLRIKGRVKRGTTAWFTFSGSGDASRRATIHLDAPTYVVTGSAFQIGSGLNLYFNAPSNDLGGVWFWFNQNGATLHTTVPYAFADAVNGHRSVIKMGSSTSDWDLHGCDQELREMEAKGAFRIHSDTPATLHLNTTAWNYEDTHTNSAVFADAASLSWDGTLAGYFNGVSTSTGMVQVTRGMATLMPACSWANASAAVVKGGTLVVQQRKMFGKGTAVRLEGETGTLRLDYAGSMAVKSLSVGGEELPEGVYGSAASGAPNVLGCLTGTGRLRVGQVGLYLLIR